LINGGEKEIGHEGWSKQKLFFGGFPDKNLPSVNYLTLTLIRLNLRIWGRNSICVNTSQRNWGCSKSLLMHPIILHG